MSAASGSGSSGTGPGLNVTVYGRPGCHLCADAVAVVERVRARIPFTLEQRDIDADDELLARYLERIPVVVINGEEAFELFVDERQLELRLSRVQRS